MNFNIRIFFLLLFFSAGMNAQEKDSIPKYQYSPEDPETVFFDFEAFYPIALGNHVYNEAYQIDPGIALEFDWFFKPNFTLGARLAQFTGHVQNRSITGNFSRTNFQLIGIQLGYYYAPNRAWSFHPEFGLGATSYVNRAPEDKFSDDGGAAWISAELAYRLGKSFAIYAKTGFDYHFTHIQTAASKDNYFNTNFFTSFGIGLRWHLQNPGG